MAGGTKKQKDRMQIDGKYFYRIKELGKGAYGKVCKVKDDDDNYFAVKKVAYNYRDGVYADIIKEMDFLRRFQNHPNIIGLSGYKWDNEMFTVLMEFGGIPLHKFIDEYRYQYRIEKMPEILWQLLTTLAFLHSTGMCHRDIKPDNILIEEIVREKKNTSYSDDYDSNSNSNYDDNISNASNTSNDSQEYEYDDIDVKVKLCDFGLSKALILKRNTPKTSTLWYRAPENLAELKEYTTKIDIWALGCVIYEYCTDEVLFEGNKTRDTLLKVLRTLGPVPDEDLRRLRIDKSALPPKWRKYPMIPIKDPQLDRLMKRCLTIHPEKRPSAIDLLQDEYFTSKGYTMDMFNEKISKIAIKDEYYKPEALNRSDYGQNVRNEVLDWLFSVSELEGSELKPHTIFLGVELFDRVMNKWDKPIDQPNQLKYISVACLDIASKFLEIYPVDLELVYEYNNKSLYKKEVEEYKLNPSKFERKPIPPRITRDDMKEFVVKVNKYEQKILFLLNFVVLTTTSYTRNDENFEKAKIEVYKRQIE